MTSSSLGIEVDTRRIGIGTAPVGSVYGPTSLDCFELLWMLTGQARWSGAGQTHRLAPGNVLLVGPGVANTVEWQPEAAGGPAVAHTSHGYVHFALRSGRLSSERTRLLRLRGADVRADLLRYLAQLARAQPPGWQLPAATAVTALLRLTETGTLLDTGSALPLPEAVERVAAHVAAAWAQGMRPLALDELAAAASTSKGHLCRQFRAAFSLGPVRCVDLLRLAHAAHLLARSNLTVVQVAQICGYATPYHFSRRFRSAFGVPPSAYRSGPQAGTADTILARHDLTALADRIWPAAAGPIDAGRVSSTDGSTISIRDLSRVGVGVHRR